MQFDPLSLPLRRNQRPHHFYRGPSGNLFENPFVVGEVAVNDSLETRHRGTVVEFEEGKPFEFALGAYPPLNDNGLVGLTVSEDIGNSS